MLANYELRLFIAMSSFVVIWVFIVCSMLLKSTDSGAKTIRILCPSWTGRLGNIMFQYASLYGIAFRNDRTLVVNENDEICDVFPNIYAVKLKNTSECHHATKWGEYAPCSYDDYSMSITSTEKYITHTSSLQSWMYFSHVESTIRQQFKFHETIEKLCQQIVDTAVDKWRHKNNKNVSNLEIIGVHIRREDYLTNSSIKFGYQVADENYINLSMDFFRRKYKDVIFLVYTTPTSGDLLWRENHVKGIDVVLMPMLKPEIDMCALSKCNHSIITVGTFGWWSAWLANGTTVYFKNVARNNSKLRDDFSVDMSDYFYPGWIGL